MHGRKSLTRRQKEVLSFIDDYLNEHGISPTLKEIAETMKVSKITVYEHVNALVEKDYLRKEPHVSRSLVPNHPITQDGVGAGGRNPGRVGDATGERGAGIDGSGATDSGAGGTDRGTVVDLHGGSRYDDEGATPGLNLPILGNIAAGLPIEAVADEQQLDLASWFPGSRRHYVLRVKGYSMIEDHIQDGDYVVVDPDREPRNGDPVVALIEGQDATLKRFYREPNRIRLQPANSELEPIFATDVDVQGVVISVLRRM